MADEVPVETPEDENTPEEEQKDYKSLYEAEVKAGAGKDKKVTEFKPDWFARFTQAEPFHLMNILVVALYKISPRLPVPGNDPEVGLIFTPLLILMNPFDI